MSTNTLSAGQNLPIGTNASTTSRETFQQQTMLQSEQSQIIEHIEKTPVIYEKIRKEELEEIQPVIHREHDRTEVRQVTQPIVEGVVQQTQIQQKELPAEFRPLVQLGTYTPLPTPVGSCSVEQTHKLIQKKPILQETERKKIIEEIQPIVYKDVLQPTVIKETLPIYEKIIEAPIVIQETRPTRYIGVRTQQSILALAGTQALVREDIPMPLQQSCVSQLEPLFQSQPLQQVNYQRTVERQFPPC